MLQQTMRFIQQIEFLRGAGVEYLPKPDPQFAIMLSFDEATELWYDLQRGDWVGRYYYQPIPCGSTCHVVDTDPYLGLPRPPHPSSDHNVWCKIDDLTLIIKGRKDA
jgi:hypothetical protein